MNSINVVIIGDANAGIIAANKLRMHTENNVKITLIGDSDVTYFKPEGVLIPFNKINYRETIKPTDYLINYGISRIKKKAVEVNPEDRYVKLSDGSVVSYDYLIIATGDRLAPEDVPGYGESTYHFYDYNNVLKTREALQNLSGGKIVIGPASAPFQCPVAPDEFAFGMDKFLKDRGIRDNADITLIVPMDDVLPFKSISDFIKKGFSEHKINFIPKFKTASVNEKTKEITSESGETIKYDTLFLIPPHHGQKFLTDSGMAGQSGYVDVDKFKLNYKDYDNVFVIGDAANFPMKVGALGHSGAAYVAGKISSDIYGGISNSNFDGNMGCSSVYADETAFTLSFDYNSQPFVNFTTKSDYFLKYISSDTYFSAILRGVL